MKNIEICSSAAPEGGTNYWLYDNDSGLGFFTEDLQPCDLGEEHDYPTRAEAEAALARLQGRADYSRVRVHLEESPGYPLKWYLCNEGSSNGKPFFTRDLQPCRLGSEHEYDTRAEAEAALARLHFRQEHPNMPQEWYDRNETGARRAEAPPTPSVLQALSSYVAARFPGEWKAGVQVAALDGGLWYCAVHSYPRAGKRKIEAKTTGTSLDAALQVLASNLLAADSGMAAELRRALAGGAL